MGSLGTRFAKQGDVSHVCKALEATAGDVWLVDSGATCHIVSTQHLSGFRVVKKHERTANLFNASGGSIVVSGVVDLEVHFGDVFLRLEEVLVAEVGFNVISPWTASERGWKTFLAKGGSRLYKGNKKSIKLVGAQRAWSGTPVFRDEAPEVREDSLGDSAPLRKEHELEVVEHDCAHESSEVCSDFEFFPERPKAFRKLWHGVSMFELVRKPCSLNFGMLGLFGMIGMTLLLAAVFAFVAFGNQGDDGQFVAYGRECTKGARAEWYADGARGECTECARAEWDADGSRGEWWHGRGAYDAGVGSRHFARDGWSGLETRAFGARALGERGGFCLGHFAQLCRSRVGPANSSHTSAEHAVPWAGEVQPVACCKRSTRSSSSGCADPGRRRCLGALASTGCCLFGGSSTRCCLFGGSGPGCCLFGGPGCPGCQAPATRHPSWKPGSCWCSTGAERVGGRFTEASVFERTRGPPPGGRGFGPAPSGGGRRTVASSIPLLRTTESLGDVRTAAFLPGWPWVVAVRKILLAGVRG